MESITVYQKLQALPSLGVLDCAALKPTVTFNAEHIIDAIALLWKAVGGQREILESFEKEAARKRTEQDLKIQNLQSDVESRINQEARKRQQEDDKLRGELQKTRDELADLLAALRTDIGSLEGNVSSSLDAAVTQLKLTVAQTQQRVTESSSRLEALEERAQHLRDDLTAAGAKYDGELARLDRLNRSLYAVWSLSPKQVEAAVAEQRGTELLLATPPLEALSSRITAGEDRVAGLRRELGAVSATATDTAHRVTTAEADVHRLKPLPERLVGVEGDLRKLVDDQVSALRAELEALRNLRPPTARDIQVNTDGSNAAVQAALAQLGQFVHDLAGRVESLEHTMPLKCDTAILAEYAQLSDLAALEERLRELLSQRPADVKHAPAPPAAPARDAAAAGAILALKDDVEALARRVGATEKDIRSMKDAFASKEDLREACHETLKAAERAINHIYDELRKLIKAQAGAAPKIDGTAGRFRCLSCNRDAGPLSEALRERLSKSQFPPSTTLMSRETRDSPPRGARASVPGVREGASMTSSRRKLQNYYDWLQTKEGEPGADGNAGRTSTPPKTVWLGAQSGGGGPGRQCGDHGSDDPDAIGADGKYYVGVSRPGSASGHRPQSAAGLRPKSASLKREDE
jgi:chromosome segregation ATPase